VKAKITRNVWETEYCSSRFLPCRLGRHDGAESFRLTRLLGRTLCGSLIRLPTQNDRMTLNEWGGIVVDANKISHYHVPFMWQHYNELQQRLGRPALKATHEYMRSKHMYSVPETTEKAYPSPRLD